MSKAKWLLYMGLWVAVLPYLGFPHLWKTILFSLSGLVISYMSYSIYVEYQSQNGGANFDNFSENGDYRSE